MEEWIEGLGETFLISETAALPVSLPHAAIQSSKGSASRGQGGFVCRD